MSKSKIARLREEFRKDRNDNPELRSRLNRYVLGQLSISEAASDLEIATDAKALAEEALNMAIQPESEGSTQERKR